MTLAPETLIEQEQREADYLARRAAWNGDTIANNEIRAKGDVRTTFHMNPRQLEELKAACRPSRSIYKPPGNPAWQQLGEELGFEWQSVVPEGAGNTRWFRARKTPGWTRRPPAREGAPPPPPSGPTPETLALIAEIDTAIAARAYRNASLLAATIADPTEYLKQMRRIFCVALERPSKENAMRSITEHQVNPANDKIAIGVTDEPGPGGANHRYEVSGFDPFQNPSIALDGSDRVDPDRLVLLFQNGAINEVGVNGVTHEALLAIVADRLRAFQAGPYACRENALALTKLEEAMHWLHHRTRARMTRGVEGTMQK